PMMVTGPVHCNAQTYLQPQNTLTFKSDVTSAGAINTDKKPGDPLVRTAATIDYQAEHDAGGSSMTLPIGTNNSPAAVRELVQVPPNTEPPNSPLGKQRPYDMS